MNHRLDIGPFTPIDTPEQLPPHIRQWLPTGGNLVQTPAYRRLMAGAGHALQMRQVVLLSGGTGNGKTFALEALRASLTCRTRSVLIEADAERKDALVALHDCITGEDGDGLVQRKLRKRIREALSDEPTVLFVDEVQHVDISVLRNLRFALQAPGTQFALVVAGADAAQRLGTDKYLVDWIGLPVTFDPLSEATLLSTLKDWHPKLAATDNDVLLELDRARGRGRLRAWGRIVEWCCKFEPDLRAGIGAQLARDVVANVSINPVEMALP